MSTGPRPHRVSMFGAITVGVGAIVGGGIMVLAGPAFALSGPSALVAFALNGVIAVMTAMSFAEMGSAFLESGGAYTFARKVLSVRMAFVTGWVVWFAYIVAGVLYALGFGTYALALLDEALRSIGGPGWALGSGRDGALGLALLATALYAVSLVRSTTGGGRYSTWGKVIVFALLIGVGLTVLVTGGAAVPLRESLTPFFADDSLALVRTMGLTFIALQGFEIIATMAGEVEHAERRVPRAMFASLGIALLVYLPLLFVISSAGAVPGAGIRDLATRDPDTVFAVAVGNYMGRPGYWLVLVAGVLSTLSALYANILAASRIAHRMAEDRTLPWIFGIAHPRYGTPTVALFASVLTMAALLLMVADLAAAGAAASLIFLVSFTFVHGIAYLARRRGLERSHAYRSPYYPLVPVLGGAACASLALFQAFTVLSAGVVALVWLGLGALLYLSLFGRRAEVADAAELAHDVELTQLRGRAPVLLVPISNPHHAASLAQVAVAMLPPRAGKLWLLSIVPSDIAAGDDERLEGAQRAIGNALSQALGSGQRPEALVTVADQVWPEIERVAHVRGCGALLLGLGDLELPETHRALSQLTSAIRCDLAVMRAPNHFELADVERIVVPIDQRRGYDELRARILGGLQRQCGAEVVYLRVLPGVADAGEVLEAERHLSRLLADEVRGAREAVACRSDDLPAEIIARAGEHGLVLLSLSHLGEGRRGFGELAVELARRSDAGLLLIGRRPSPVSGFGVSFER